ncbi:MAG: hypothetical protein ACE367_07595 [Acidimicrobiales bacterium]
MVAIVGIVVLLSAACGGGGGGDGSTAGVQGDQVVIDPDAVAAARESLDETDQPDELTIDEADPDTLSGGDGGSTDDGDGIEVAEADEDELDGLLNSLTQFNTCLADDGFEFIGAPGFGDGGPEDFDDAYLAALGACAAESDILAAAEGFASAQSELTPEEIELNNLGLPAFRDCMIGLGWEVGELVPDERGALTFAGDGGDFGLTPPDGGGLADFDAGDIDRCRTEAEQFVADSTADGG